MHVLSTLGTDATVGSFFKAYEETKPQYLILNGPRNTDLSNSSRLSVYIKHMNTLLNLHMLHGKKFILIDNLRGPTWSLSSLASTK